MSSPDRHSHTAQNVEIYRELVTELTCDTTDEKKVKKLMQQLGLRYSTEKIERLSEVLAYSPASPIRIPNKGADRDL